MSLELLPLISVFRSQLRTLLKIHHTKGEKKNYHIATTSFLSLWQAESRTPNCYSKEFI